MQENIENSPLCLESLHEHDKEHICFGDENGTIQIIEVDGKRSARDSTVFKTSARQKHKDWVKKVLHERIEQSFLSLTLQQVRYYQDVGLISCSLDKTLKVFDLMKRDAKDTMKGHEKGAESFSSLLPRPTHGS